MASPTADPEMPFPVKEGVQVLTSCGSETQTATGEPAGRCPGFGETHFLHTGLRLPGAFLSEVQSFLSIL